MVEMSIVYQGEKHCELTHGPSGSKIETDAPQDNMGRGARFSPTDLIGAALASCVLTTMAIVAEREDLKANMTGATAKIVKEMVSTPTRKIGKLSLEIRMPKGIPQNVRDRLHKIADHCPVKRSLNPDVETPMQIIYPD